ncbi:MAG: sigma-54-dependent Fis family transcriptional regulator [Desulfuromonadales bacterium]|nr:sigma-54-dependent Fis family transcriptional regulator [Desulfuromonadales bacterium]
MNGTTTLSPAFPILLVDDEKPWLRSLSLSLKEAAGYDNFLTCNDSREVLPLLAEQSVSLILLDMTMPHLSGEELLAQIVAAHPEIPVIVLSGLNQIETAVACMRRGAFDYYVKTVELERLVTAIQRAFDLRALQQENLQLQSRVLNEELDHPQAFALLLTGSARLRGIFRYVEAVATSPEPVLITGESGVGKELLAKAVHTVSRPGLPWVAVNVAGLDDPVFSDTLFGHLKGAYTGADQGRPGMIEKAEGGVLFLDEIGDLRPASQIKLLRLLQDGEFYPLGSDTPRRCRARLVLATNQDLAARQASGEFRKDLYYRLTAHRVHMPSLADRPEDLPLLLDHFLEEAARELGRAKPTVPPELITLLGTYNFPGNVRELRAMVFHAISQHRGGILGLTPFREAMGLEPGCPMGVSEPPVVSFAGPLPSLEETGNMVVAEALRRAKGNRSIAARLLGISRQALCKRLKKVSC